MGLIDSLTFWRSRTQEIPLGDHERAMLAGSTRRTIGEVTGGSSRGSPRKGSREIMRAYGESPPLRSVAHHVGSTVAAVRWRLLAAPKKKDVADSEKQYRFPNEKLARSILSAPPGARADERHAIIKRAQAEGELDEIVNHPWHDLMARPNARMTGRIARQMTVTSYDLIGEAGWVLDIPEGMDVPMRAWPVPGTWIVGRPTEKEPWFTVEAGGGCWNVPIDCMLMFIEPDPLNPYGRGLGIGNVLADEVDIDEHAAKTVAAWFQNMAMPEAIVAFKGARPEVLRKTKADWMNLLGGFRKMYTTHFTNVDVDVKRLDTSFKDQQLVALRQSERDLFQQTWGVPPEKLGIITNSNRATSEAAQAIDAQDVMIPRLEVLREQFQALAWMFDERLVVEYDNPVPADETARQQAITTLGGRFRIDEERALAHLPPLPDKAGEGFIIPPGVTYVGDLRSLAQTGPALQPSHLASGLMTNNEARARIGLAETSEPWGKERVVGIYMPGGAALLDDPPDDDGGLGGDGGESAEGLTLSLDQLSRAIRKRSRPRIAAPKQRGRLTVGEMRAVIRSVRIGPMYDELGPVVEDLVETFGQETLDDLASVMGEDKTFDSDTNPVRAHMRALAEQRIGQLINETTRDELRSAFETAIKAEGDHEQILLDAAKSVFDRARVERSIAIADSESVTHSGFATQQAMKQSGLPLKKEWIATHDGRAREAHLDMDGQLVALDDAFVCPSGTYSGAKAMYPGSFRIAAMDINCRCAVGNVLDEKELSAEQLARCPKHLLRSPESKEDRALLWRAHDSKREPWQIALRKAAGRGFDRQEVAVVEALREALLS